MTMSQRMTPTEHLMALALVPPYFACRWGWASVVGLYAFLLPEDFLR